MDVGSLATVASVIAAFGAAMFVFRLQRELLMQEKGERVWLPAADWLLVVATILCLLLVAVSVSSRATTMPAAAAGSAVILVAGYIFAILAHYRILFGRKWLFWGMRRTGPRSNPESSELVLILVTVASAALFFGWRVFQEN